MKIQVRLFATLKEKIARSHITLEIPAETSVEQLKIILKTQYPVLGNDLDHIITAINHEFAKDDQIIPENAEVAFFPPVSGGNGLEDIIQITKDEIGVDQILSQLVSDTSGGISLFIGVVRRRTTRGGPIQTRELYYEAYEPMAVEKMRQIVSEMRNRWIDIDRIALIQRVGVVHPGIPSVLIACAGSHRDTGIFEAVRYGIDRLKEIVPVWKKEITESGEIWVEGDYFPFPDEK